MSAFFVRSLAALGVFAAAAAAWALPEVEPADLEALDPGQFTGAELDVPERHGADFPLPYYVNHLHRLANAVEADGPDRGFIRLEVWRNPQDNEPYNARIMENILSLAYFYCKDRDWNPYRGDPALRARLEAAIEFWLSRQDGEGRFSEYAEEQWALAPTAFAAKFAGEALRLLEDGPPIDQGIHERFLAGHRKLFRASFEDEWTLSHAKRFTNQWGNYWPGALAHIDITGDETLRDQLHYWIERTSLGGEDSFQSPAGYFYEAGGPCWRYNLGTHMSNTHMAWRYATGGGFFHLTEPDETARDWLVSEHELFGEWLAYNAAPEPGGGFLLNRAIETRQRITGFAKRELPMAEAVDLFPAFMPTETEVEERRAAIRAEVEEAWPSVAPLETGEFWAYSPYAFLHRSHPLWHPAEEEREAALAMLPHNARDRFTHQRTDETFVFTYVRRPAYYAAFNAGGKATNQQRMGLGLLWDPSGGTLLQSQSGSDGAAWGTRAEEADAPYEADGLPLDAVTFEANGDAITAEPGTRDLPGDDEPFTVRYSLGDEENAGAKTVAFEESRIGVTVEHGGAFTEQIPLFTCANTAVSLEDGAVRVERNGAVMTLRFEGADALDIADYGGDLGVDFVEDAGIQVITVEGSGEMTYAFEW